MKAKFLHSQTLVPDYKTFLLRQLRRGYPFNLLDQDEQTAVVECYSETFPWISKELIRKIFVELNPNFRVDFGHWIFCKGGQFDAFWSVVYPLKKGGIK